MPIYHFINVLNKFKTNLPTVYLTMLVIIETELAQISRKIGNNKDARLGANRARVPYLPLKARSQAHCQDRHV